MARRELTESLPNTRLICYWVMTGLLMAGSILVLIVHAFWAWPLVPLALLLSACMPLLQKALGQFLRRLRSPQGQTA